MFLERAQNRLTTMMRDTRGFQPQRIAMQRARILLPLAWLVRVNNTQGPRMASDGVMALTLRLLD